MRSQTPSKTPVIKTRLKMVASAVLAGTLIATTSASASPDSQGKDTAATPGNCSVAPDVIPEGANLPKAEAQAAGPAPELPQQAAGDNTQPGGNSARTAPGAGQTRRIIFRPGDSLAVGTDTEDLVPTDDVELARAQVAAYPDNPEASFILAVALTRTSHVEEALAEVRRARKLAEGKGGPAYFDRMIATYEQMLKYHPKENRVRYGLAWAYYMKAYLIARYSRRAARAGKTSEPRGKTPNAWEVAQAASQGKILPNLPRIPGALEGAEPSAQGQIRKYYEAALARLDELLAQKPDDIWAKVYRAFLKAEYTGNLEEAMTTWKACQAQAPDNPAPYFFLGEGYLRQGNLKECLNNISRAIALRAAGK